ncbi:DUF5709 domain-containing protein [Catenulispora subtropica]|uniref:DUF5709 domain-containing protein n=1 Tax=Catenulispora subtropica TaxID=450798 RepID=A0ABP5DYV1_9ACTN
MSDNGTDSTIDPENYDAAEELDQLEAQDSQVGGADPLETGYSPPERPLGMREELTLDERLAEEVPDPDADPGPDQAGDAIGDLAGGTGEPVDDQVGGARSGRLVAPDEGAHADLEKDLVAQDVGIDGGAASAEEAAVHVVNEDDLAGAEEFEEAARAEVHDESEAT